MGERKITHVTQCYVIYINSYNRIFHGRVKGIFELELSWNNPNHELITDPKFYHIESDP